ncbi:MAG: SDR family oxidoreductase [Pyrinomonadaceae bacterium]|nr:SDR family oxidoreductase [Pyrinomonadaceae bacterium]
MINNKILVTGATGTIGSFLVDRLAALGAQMEVLVRSRQQAETFAARGIASFIGDFAHKETLAPALVGVGKLFLLSAANPQQVEWQGNMIEAARRAGVPHIIKLSASCAGPFPHLPIKRWHYETEEQLKESGVPYTFLRPNCFMQNSLHWARTIREKGLFYLPVGDARVSQVDARDIAAVAAAVLTGSGHESQTYEITGSEAITFEEVAEHLSAALGKKVRYARTTFDESRQHMLEYGMEEWLAAAVTQTYHLMSEGGSQHVTDNVSQLTGNDPITFAQFARDHVERFLQRGQTLKHADSRQPAQVLN